MTPGICLVHQLPGSKVPNGQFIAPYRLISTGTNVE